MIRNRTNTMLAISILGNLVFFLRILLSADSSPSTTNHGGVVGEVFDEIGFYQSLNTTTKSPLFSLQSEFQKIEIFQSGHYGKMLVLVRYLWGAPVVQYGYYNQRLTPPAHSFPFRHSTHATLSRATCKLWLWKPPGWCTAANREGCRCLQRNDGTYTWVWSALSELIPPRMLTLFFFFYHPIVLIALFQHPLPKRVLVLGGGDGYGY